ncbi:MAG TPA: hypothetical protein DHV60_01535 [Verrucomicrobiales bacterium]|nr:hypothetical protein [Verrucomicrobiales bacterium]
MHNYWKTLCLSTLLCTALHADTIVLKSGEKHTGRVISENSTSYLFEIDVTNSIKDELRIPKDDVKQIIKESIESKDFKLVASMVPVRDLQPATAYPERIKITKTFIRKFPKSEYNETVNKILTTLESEYNTIIDGGIKLDGQLISRQDKEANAYDIDARRLLLDIQRYAATRRYTQALRKWEVLQSDYRNSTSFKSAIPIAKRIIYTYQKTLKSLLDTVDERTAERKSAMSSMNANDRERTELALAEQQRRYATQIEREKAKSRIKWLTVDTYDKASISHNYRQTTSSLKSIASASRTKQKELKLAGPIHRDAWTALAKGDLKDAEQHIKTLQSLRIPKQYLTPLQTNLKESRGAMQIAIKEAKKNVEAEKLRQIKLDKEAADGAKKNKKGQTPAPKP